MLQIKLQGFGHWKQAYLLDMAFKLIAFLEKNLDYLKLENLNEKMLDVERQLKNGTL
jgi:hypothetical protein